MSMSGQQGSSPPPFFVEASTICQILNVFNLKFSLLTLFDFISDVDLQSFTEKFSRFITFLCPQSLIILLSDLLTCLN